MKHRPANSERRTARSVSAQPVQRSRFGLNSKRAHPPYPPWVRRQFGGDPRTRSARFKFALEVRAGDGSFPAETALDGRGNSTESRQSLLRGTDVPTTRTGANVGDAGAAAGRSVRGGGPATPVGQTSRPGGRPGGGGSARYEDKEV